jgi:hypothetical protein
MIRDIILVDGCGLHNHVAVGGGEYVRTLLTS